MKKNLLILQFLVAVLTQLNAQKIYEIFTGAGGTYPARYVVLSGFAPNASVVGKSIQHRGSSSTNWLVINLTGNADAQGLYRIWLLANTTGAPWTPELANGTSFTLTNTGNAQLALMNNTTVITDGTCPSGVNLLDLVGYRGTANPTGESVCRETSSAPAATATNLKRRRKGALPGQDTGDNSNDFEIVSASAALPIELVSFDVQNTEGGKNHLTWTTASEKDNSHFDIERSTDGNTFHNIGQVKGNNKPSSYQYTDNQPFSTSYYRLKQVDYDGTATYSKVVSVTSKGGKALKVYPTLVSNGFLTVDGEGSDYEIYNIVGQQVQNGKTTQRLDVSALAKGTYILRVGTEQAKFVKQ